MHGAPLKSSTTLFSYLAIYKISCTRSKTPPKPKNTLDAYQSICEKSPGLRRHWPSSYGPKLPRPGPNLSCIAGAISSTIEELCLISPNSICSVARREYELSGGETARLADATALQVASHWYGAVVVDIVVPLVELSAEIAHVELSCVQLFVLLLVGQFRYVEVEVQFDGKRNKRWICRQILLRETSHTVRNRFKVQ